MENHTMKLKGDAGLDQKQEPDYVFKESGRKIQVARDSKQIERKMVIYGRESGTGKAGDSEN